MFRLSTSWGHWKKTQKKKVIEQQILIVVVSVLHLSGLVWISQILLNVRISRSSEEHLSVTWQTSIFPPLTVCALKNSPIVQDSDDFPRLEGELVVLRGLKVIDGADFPAVGLVRGEQPGGVRVKARQGGLRLLALLLQRQLDGCTQETQKSGLCSKLHDIFLRLKPSINPSEYSTRSIFFFVEFLLVSLPLARSSSSFLFVEVEGSFATKAGLAFACSAACGKKKLITCLFESTTRRIKG